MGSCWQVSRPRCLLRTGGGFAVVADGHGGTVYCVFVVGLVHSEKKRALNFCNLTQVFTLCEREVGLRACPVLMNFCSASHMRSLVTFSPQQDTGLEWRDLLIFLFLLDILCSPRGRRGLAAQPGRGAEMDRRGSTCARAPGEERGETGPCGLSHPALGVLMPRFCLVRCLPEPARF